MADGPGWSAAQWETVNNVITEAFEKASIVAQFLPRYGPLPESAEYVKNELVDGRSLVTVEDDKTLKLFNLAVTVKLSREQVYEESLSSASLAFRRAARTLAQVEDQLVLNGRTPQTLQFGARQSSGQKDSLEAVIKTQKNFRNGLIGAENVALDPEDGNEKPPKTPRKASPTLQPPTTGGELVTRIVEATNTLEIGRAHV